MDDILPNKRLIRNTEVYRGLAALHKVRGISRVVKLWLVKEKLAWTLPDGCPRMPRPGREAHLQFEVHDDVLICVERRVEF